MPLTNTEMTVLLFGDRKSPRSLAARPTVVIEGLGTLNDALEQVLPGARRVAVVGSDADLAAVLTRLMRVDRLDVEVAHVRGFRGARRAGTAAARRVPLIRDDTGTVLVGAALWLPPEGSTAISGEAVADDAVLFDGTANGVRIEPTAAMPGLRATVLGATVLGATALGAAVLGGRPRKWHTARAVQLGTTGARVVRDGVPGRREVRRSTFYRHTTGWLRVG